jgi:membrane-bound lytic murein transglycosylase B
LVLFTAATLPQALFAASADDDRRAELQAQLNQLEKEIAENQAMVDRLAAEGKSLSTEVQTLNAQIKKAQLQVQATQVAIGHLNSNIKIHQKTITTLSDKLQNEKDSLAQILRRTDEIDTFSLVELAFSRDDLSKLLGDLDSYALIKRSLGQSYEKITGVKLQTEVEKAALEEQRKQQQQVAQLQLAAKQKVQVEQNKKQQLLTATKGEESRYQQIVAAKQKSVAQIRAELFGLAGGGGKIPLPTAIEYAKTASRISGVRAAFILAILSQESDLGANTGQCYVTSLETGDGKGKNTGTPFSGVMKVPRDTVPFKQITEALGRDWSTTAVSCPQAGGYGGAMGPTQFIPSTWIGVAPQVKSALGLAAADPWNPLHAITATGLYLSAVGGGGGSYSAEHTAAAKYYAGGGWATAGQVYANSVMDKAAQFQSDIDTLAGN